MSGGCSGQQQETRPEVRHTHQLFPMHSHSNSRNFLSSAGTDSMYSVNENGIEFSGSSWPAAPAVIFEVLFAIFVFFTAGLESDPES